MLGEVEVRTENAELKAQGLLGSQVFPDGADSIFRQIACHPEQKLRETIRQLGEFDAYVLNGVTLAGAFVDVFKDKPCLFVAHNVEHRSAEENAQNAGGIQKFLFQREAGISKGLETRLCQRGELRLHLRAG